MFFNCEFYHSKIEKKAHFPQKIYKLSKTNIFFSRFEGMRGEKIQIFRTLDLCQWVEFDLLIFPLRWKYFGRYIRRDLFV